MPSYHSVFNEKSYSTSCGIPLIDFKTAKLPDMDSSKLKAALNEIEVDIIDEALMLFRANVLFKNFPIKGDADKLLVYMFVFMSKCLESIYPHSQDPDKAKQVIKSLVEDAEWMHTLKSYFFNALTTIKQNEIVSLQQYLKTVRKELANRLIYILFDSDSKTLDLKYWLTFGKRKFLGYDMPTLRK